MSADARRGRLVAVEGIDGVGKSTFIRGVARELRKRGLRVSTWREPVDRELGRRAQLASARDPWAGALLFTLDRARASERLDRLLARSDLVLSDRSFYSTLAYQVSAMVPSRAEVIRRLQPRVTRVPDRVIWLRLAPDTALTRVAGRGGTRSPLERAATMRRVHRAYTTLARARRWITIDAAQPTPVVVAEGVRRLARTPAARPRG